jgi:hypothetical protein
VLPRSEALPAGQGEAGAPPWPVRFLVADGGALTGEVAGADLCSPEHDPHLQSRLDPRGETSGTWTNSRSASTAGNRAIGGCSSTD